MSSQCRTSRPAVPALPPVHQRGGCVKKANYFLPRLVVVGTIEQVVVVPPPVVVTVTFLQFGLLGPWGTGIVPSGLVGTRGIVPSGLLLGNWRLTLRADTTRGARRAMESLKNNISVKQVK
jgi:hypothetical protein